MDALPHLLRRTAHACSAFHITTGPAATYWNPANRADTNYTVKATFQEPKFMDLNSHPHSYGLFIGGNDIGTPEMTLVYCVAYGSGNALIRSKVVARNARSTAP
jgi:hypothetical protein